MHCYLAMSGFQLLAEGGGISTPRKIVTSSHYSGVVWYVSVKYVVLYNKLQNTLPKWVWLAGSIAHTLGVCASSLTLLRRPLTGFYLGG